MKIEVVEIKKLSPRRVLMTGEMQDGITAAYVASAIQSGGAVLRQIAESAHLPAGEMEPESEEKPKPRSKK